MIETISMLAVVGLAVSATVLDLKDRRIPNVLTLSALGVALLLRAAMGGEALVSGLLGAAVALAIAVPLFAVGAFGGGDGKMLMAVGALVGLESLDTALLATALAGGLLALGAVLRRGALLGTLANVHLMLADLSTEGSTPRRTIATPGSITVPYGVALAFGALVGWFA